MNCEIVVPFEIFLNREIQQPTGYGQNGKVDPSASEDNPVNVSWEQVYGHEQKHVASVNQIMTEFAEEESASNTNDGKFLSRSVCEDNIEEQQNDFITAINRILDSGHNHHPATFLGEKDENSNENSPIEGVGYPPFPGSPPLPPR